MFGIGRAHRHDRASHPRHRDQAKDARGAVALSRQQPGDFREGTDHGGTKTIIDTHHHLCAPAYVGAGGREPGMLAYAGADAAQRRRRRNRSRTWTAPASPRSIISLTTPGVWFGDATEARAAGARMQRAFRQGRRRSSRPLRHVRGPADARHRRAACARSNTRSTRSRPTASASITSYDEQASGRCRLRAGLGRAQPAQGGGLYPSARGPIAAPICCRRSPRRSIEYGTDTTRTIASLVFSGTAARCPDINFLFSHAGGTMPFLIGRFIGLAQLAAIRRRACRNGVLHELQRFYYDLAQASNPGADRVADEAGADLAGAVRHRLPVSDRAGAYRGARRMRLQRRRPHGDRSRQCRAHPAARAGMRGRALRLRWWLAALLVLGRARPAPSRWRCASAGRRRRPN